MQTDEDLIRQARSLFEKGDFAGAEKAYRELIELMPEHEHVNVELIIGACQQAQGHGDEAIETIKRAVEMDTSRAESWFQLGCAHRQAGDEKRATRELQKAITLDPNHALARVERGRQCLAAGDAEGADQHFRTALRADPNCVPALVSRAERLLNEGKLDQAQELAARAVQYQPGSAPAQLVMSRIFRKHGHLDFAERCLNNALEILPNNADLHAAKAQLMFEGGRLGECLDAVDRAGHLGAYDDRLFHLRLHSLRRLGRVVEARQMLEVVARTQSLDAGYTLALAELRIETGDPAGAAELLETLDEAAPTAAQLMRAMLAELEGDAGRAAERATELHDDEDERVRAQSRLLSGRLALESDDAARCIEVLEPLAFEDPGDPKVHALLARAFDQLGRYDEAGKHLSRAGWFMPPILREREREMPGALYRALDDLNVADWETTTPDDGRPRPVFILGWPGSGRGVLINALAESGGVTMFGREGAERRREALGLPAWPDQLFAADEAQRRITRKRYLREAGTDASRVLETLWLPAAALPAIARYLPGSTVIVADADLRDLELEWRLVGFQGVESLRDLWQREQAALEKLMDVLPLDFQVFSRGDLEKDLSGVVAQLGKALDVADADALSTAIARQLKSLRSTGHWENYKQLFKGKSAS